MVFKKMYRPVWKICFQAKQVYNSVRLNERHIGKKYRIEISRTEPFKGKNLHTWGIQTNGFPSIRLWVTMPRIFWHTHTSRDIEGKSECRRLRHMIIKIVKFYTGHLKICNCKHNPLCKNFFSTTLLLWKLKHKIKTLIFLNFKLIHFLP